MSGAAFQDQVVILTGASSGIGWSMALQLAKQGAKLALAARREEKLLELAAQCEALGGQAMVVATDVADEAQCKNLVEKTVEAYGRVDTLINNAGITMWAKFEDMEVLEPYEKVMRVNYLGSVNCTHYALPYLKESGGRITAVSSVAGKTGVPFRSGYSASKFAMAGFFEAIRIELAKYGISVTMTYPDFVQTDTRLQGFGADGKPLTRRPLREGKRMMNAEEAAAIILDATAKRKREVVMSLRGRLGMWVKLIAPSIVDGIASRAVEGVD
jgi:NAD(P)-dependent dehydrogenase (short-subunit alcohol dehydrogenase family)